MNLFETKDDFTMYTFLYLCHRCCRVRVQVSERVRFASEHPNQCLRYSILAFIHSTFVRIGLDHSTLCLPFWLTSMLTGFVQQHRGGEKRERERASDAKQDYHRFASLTKVSSFFRQKNACMSLQWFC